MLLSDNVLICERYASVDLRPRFAGTMLTGRISEPYSQTGRPSFAEPSITRIT
jgi:hypothetical protein